MLQDWGDTRYGCGLVLGNLIPCTVALPVPYTCATRPQKTSGPVSVKHKNFWGDSEFVCTTMVDKRHLDSSRNFLKDE